MQSLLMISLTTWIFYLKTKDQVFDVLMDVMDLVENQSGKKIMISRTNNGGKFTSNKFKDFLQRS